MTRTNDLVANVADLMARLEKVEADLAELLRTYTEFVNTSNERNVQVDARLTAVEEVAAAVHTRVTTLETYLDPLQSAVTGLREVDDDLRTRVTSLEQASPSVTDTTALDAHLTTVDAQVGAVAGQLGRQVTRIDDTCARLDAIEDVLRLTRR